MKKCPYCAEEIQDEAIVCRYCGRELETRLPPEDRKKCPDCAEWIRAEAKVCRYCGQEFEEKTKVSKRKLCPKCGKKTSMVRANCPYCGVALVEPPKIIPTSAAVTPIEASGTTKEPSILSSLLYGLAILFLIDGIAAFFLFGSQPSFFTTDIVAIEYGVGKLVFAYFGAKGWKPGPVTFRRYVGVLLFSLIPVAGWVVLYWAGKHFARAATNWQSLYLIPIGIILIWAALMYFLYSDEISIDYLTKPQSGNSLVYRPTATRFRPSPTNTPNPVNRGCFMGICEEKENTQSPLCLSPDMLTIQDRGKTVVVCGRVIGEGERNCPTCSYGQYYYLTLKSGFDIISYDWNFLSSMVGMCVMVSDKVEILAGKPVFVFGSAEGYAGSRCTRLGDGTLECREGDYFRVHYGCK